MQTIMSIHQALFSDKEIKQCDNTIQTSFPSNVKCISVRFEKQIDRQYAISMTRKEHYQHFHKISQKNRAVGHICWFLRFYWAWTKTDYQIANVNDY